MLVPVWGTGVSGAVGTPFRAPRALRGALHPAQELGQGALLAAASLVSLGAGEVTLSCQGDGKTI